MIIEFCGLPGSGKSTFIKQLKITLRDAGLPVEVKNGPTFYHDMKSYKNIIKGIILCFLNICLKPVIAYTITKNIITCKSLSKKNKFFKIYISLQYHINWINFRKKLCNTASNSCITIIDGSPYNILNDIPNCQLQKLIKYVEKCYNNKNLNLIIFAELESQTCLRLINSRSEQPLEPVLYGNLVLLKFIEKQFIMLKSLLLVRNQKDQTVLGLNLFLQNSTTDFANFVAKEWSKNDEENITRES